MTRDTLDLGSWVVLQMAGADTLRVVEALTSHGLGAWTPVKWSTARKPVTRSRYDKPHPVMPGYVFGDVGHVDQFYRLSGLRRRDIPRFWFLESELAGCTPLIADHELEGLRREEARLRAIFDAEKRKGIKPPTFETGASVRMEDGAYAGLSGEVKGKCGKDSTWVSIPGFAGLVKVASLLLLESVARDEVPVGKAA